MSLNLGIQLSCLLSPQSLYVRNWRRTDSLWNHTVDWFPPPDHWHVSYRAFLSTNLNMQTPFLYSWPGCFLHADLKTDSPWAMFWETRRPLEKSLLITESEWSPRRWRAPLARPLHLLTLSAFLWEEAHFCSTHIPPSALGSSTSYCFSRNYFLPIFIPWNLDGVISISSVLKMFQNQSTPPSPLLCEGKAGPGYINLSDLIGWSLNSGEHVHVYCFPPKVHEVS